jgi:hypothetical protein
MEACKLAAGSLCKRLDHAASQLIEPNSRVGTADKQTLAVLASIAGKQLYIGRRSCRGELLALPPFAAAVRGIVVALAGWPGSQAAAPPG